MKKLARLSLLITISLFTASGYAYESPHSNPSELICRTDDLVGRQAADLKSNIDALISTLKPNALLCSKEMNKVLEVLEAALAEYRHHQDPDLPYLAIPQDYNPLETFMDFAKALKKDDQITYGTSLNEWAILAATYLKITLKGLKAESQLAEIPALTDEIQHRADKKKTSYLWFTLFADRLTILLSSQERSGKVGFNDGFDTYKVTQLEEAWKTHKSYKQACQERGSHLVRQLLSPVALCRNLFPDIIMLPYPFPLSDTDLVYTMPTPNSSNFWPIGFNLRPTYADRAYMTPSTFFTHDQHHLGIFVWSLSDAPNLTQWKRRDGTEAIEYTWKETALLRTLFFAAVNQLQAMTRDCLQNGENDEIKRLTSFFSFYNLHEGTKSIHFRLSEILNPQVRESVLNESTQYFLDPHYYFELLPSSLQSLKNQPEEFRQQLLSHFANLASKFETSLRRTHAGDEMLSSHINRALTRSESYGWNSFIFTGYTPPVHEDELSSTHVVPGFTATNSLGQAVDRVTFYSRYFLGSPLYLGETPPPHKDHIFIYKPAQNSLSASVKESS